MRTIYYKTRWDFIYLVFRESFFHPRKKTYLVPIEKKEIHEKYEKCIGSLHSRQKETSCIVKGKKQDRNCHGCPYNMPIEEFEKETARRKIKFQEG